MKIQGTGAIAPQHLKVFLGGKNKTEFAASFPNPFFLTADDTHLVTIRDLDVPYALVECLEDLVALRLALNTTPEEREAVFHTKVDTVVLDTVNDINYMIMAEHLKKERRDYMTGPDWGWQGERMREILGGFRNLPLHVVLTSSLKQSEDQDTGRRIMRPGVSGVADEIADYANIALLLKENFGTEPEGDGNVKLALRKWAVCVSDANHDWPHDDFNLLPKEGFDLDGKEFQFIYNTVFPDGPPESRSEYKLFFENTPEGYDFDTEPQKAQENLPPIGKSDTEEFKCEGPLVVRGKGEGSCGKIYESQDQYEASKIKYQVSLCPECSASAGKPTQ